MHEGAPDSAGRPHPACEHARGVYMRRIVPAGVGAHKRLLPLFCPWYIVESMHVCHFCATEIANPREVYRNSTCSKCGRDLKICLNCRFYSPGAHWDCAESVDEPVHDKDRANFCTFFTFRTGQHGAPSAPSKDAGQEARRKIDKLFGDET
jgi:hypothetical protein